MFDGPEVWSMGEPQRDNVMEKMWDAIQSWDVSSHRNINYRLSLYYVLINVMSANISICESNAVIHYQELSDLYNMYLLTFILPGWSHLL